MRKILLLAATLLLACGDSPAEPKQQDITGTYSLHTIDGAPLPVLIDYGVSISSGTLTLSSGGTLQEITTLTDGSTSVSYTTTANWRREGNDLIIFGYDVYNGLIGPAPVGWIDGNQIRFNTQYFNVVYRRN